MNGVYWREQEGHVSMPFDCLGADRQVREGGGTGRGDGGGAGSGDGGGGAGRG